MATRSLVHINNHLLCAIDLETTGRTPGYHEILQLAIVPLDNWLEPRKDLPIFDQKFRPRRLDRVDFEALEVSKTKFDEIVMSGIDPEKGFELFEYWFEKLNLPERKMIMPLGFFISTFDIPFLRDWMGSAAFGRYIHGFTRDVAQVCHYLNDVSDFHCEQTPFNKMTLRQVARHAGVEVFDELTHDALYDAYLSAQIYRKLLSHSLINAI